MTQVWKIKINNYWIKLENFLYSFFGNKQQFDQVSSTYFDFSRSRIEFQNLTLKIRDFRSIFRDVCWVDMMAQDEYIDPRGSNNTLMYL